MLEWAQTAKGSRLVMLVHHDDARREYSYGVDSNIGPFPQTLMAEANSKGWIVVSIKKDWKRVFSFEDITP